MIIHRLHNDPSSIALRDTSLRASTDCMNPSENETSFKYGINLTMIVSNCIQLFYSSNDVQYSSQSVSHYIYQLILNYHYSMPYLLKSKNVLMNLLCLWYIYYLNLESTYFA